MQSEDRDGPAESSRKEDYPSSKSPLEEILNAAKSAIGPFRGFEPSSDDRESAARNWSQYQAHIQVGFSQEQALEIVLAPLNAIAAEAYRWIMEHPEDGKK